VVGVDADPPARRVLGLTSLFDLFFETLLGFSTL
jgi:hypothetical protein